MKRTNCLELYIFCSKCHMPINMFFKEIGLNFSGKWCKLCKDKLKEELGEVKYKIWKKKNDAWLAKHDI